MLKKVFAGDPISAPSAADRNALIDAAIAYQRDRHSTTPRPPRPANRSSTLVRVHNATADDFEQYQVVGLDEPLISPDDDEEGFLEATAFDVVAATKADHAGRFGILQRPLASGDVATACVWGVTIALVYVTDEAHKFADLRGKDADEEESSEESEGANALQSCATGPVRILWKPEGDGLVWAYVCIGASPAPGFQIRNDTGQDLTAGQIVGLDGPVEAEKDYHDDYDQDVEEESSAAVDPKIMIGVVPEYPKHAGMFAIVTEDIADGETGAATIDGLAVCYVDFSKVPDCAGLPGDAGLPTYADIDPESPSLDSLVACMDGAAQVLWSDGDATLVRLGTPRPPGKLHAILLGELTAGESVPATIYLADGTTFTAEVSCWLLEGDRTIPATSRCYVELLYGQLEVTEAACLTP